MVKRLGVGIIVVLATLIALTGQPASAHQINAFPICWHARGGA